MVYLAFTLTITINRDNMLLVQRNSMENIMRQIISIVIALVFASLSPLSAYADDYRRHYNEEDVAAGIIVGLGLAIVGTAIIHSASTPSGQTYYYPQPNNQWHGGKYQQGHHSKTNRQYGHGEPMMDCRRNIMPAGNIPGRYRDQDTGILCSGN